MEKPLQTLHKSLLKNNYDVPEDYDSFEKTLTAKGDEGYQNRFTLWQSLRDNGYDVPDNYESFSKTLIKPVYAPKPQNDPRADLPANPQPQPKPQQEQASMQPAQTPTAPKASPVPPTSVSEERKPKVTIPWEVEEFEPQQPKKKAEDPRNTPARPVPEPDRVPLNAAWDSQGNSMEMGRTKPFAPGQVRENEKVDATQFGTPYRPDTQLTVAQRDEIYRRNDFAVKQVQKMQNEKKRRDLPLVDTGIPEANNSIIKTQGQWEDEFGKSVKRISSSFMPAVDKAIAEFDKKADEVWGKYNEQSKFVDSASPMSIEIGRQANEAKDPDKIMNYLQQQMEDVYKDGSFIEEVGKEADKLGVDRGKFFEEVVKPQILSDLNSRLTDTLVKRELPRSTAEYILNGLGNSIAGMLYNAITETKGQRAIKNEAEAMTEEGGNPYYTPDTAASLAKMGVSFAADAPFFGVYGRVTGQVAKQIAEREIKNLVAQGLSETAARSVIGTALENSVGARMKNYLMQHIVSGSLTMGAYNATSETARQIRDKEGMDLGKIAGSTAEGLAVGAAFGGTGAVSQALSQPLSGFAKLSAKVAGFGAEAETMYATEELTKLIHGEDAFENPFEGSVEALMKLGVMKVSSPGGLTKAIGEVMNPVKNNQRQHTGVNFTPEEETYIRNTTEGKSLLESLSQMHPGRAISEVNGKKKLTKEGEALRVQLSQNYEDFMNNKDIPANVKQKTAAVLGGVYRPGLETGADIIQNEDGTVLVKTRDKDGNCIQDIKFDTLAEAEQWRTSHQSECRRNDAVNMWNNSTDAARQEIVDAVRDQISGESQAAEMLERANGMRQNRMKRELEKLNQFVSDHEGRELTDEEARNYIQMVIRDGDDATFNEMYQLIHDKAYPKDMPDVSRNYWEGRQLSPLERHIAQVDAQLAEERLRLLGEDFAEEVAAAAQYPDEKIEELAQRLKLPDTKGGITTEQFKAAVNYYNKMSKLNGMFDEALNSVDNQVEAANAYVRRNTHADSGSLIDVTNAEKPDRGYYVTAGHFEVTPDGRLRPTDNSGIVILRDKETGDIEVVSPGEVTVNSIDDPNRVIAGNDSMEGLRGRLMKEADDSVELHPDTPTEAANGDIYTGADGNQYMAMQIQDEAGNPVWAKVAIDENGEVKGSPMPFDIEEYRKAKSNEIDAAERPQEETAAPTEEEEQAIVPEVEDVVPGTEDVVPETDEVVPEQPEKPDVASEQLDNDQNQQISARHRIPLDKNAEPEYEKAKPEDTYDALVEEFGEEYATALVRSEIDDAKRRMPKPRVPESPSIPSGLSVTEKARALRQQIARRKAQEEADRQAAEEEQAKIDYWNSVMEVPKARKAEAERIKAEEAARQAESERRQKMQTPEGRLGLLGEAKNSQERRTVAKEIYGDLFNENLGEPDTVEELVSLLLPYGKLNWEGYDRGTTHVRGLQEELGSQFTRGLAKERGTAGFNSYLAKKGEGESLETIAHQIYEDDANLTGDEHRFTTEEIRNAVIGMLLSAEKPTDIRDYTLNSRIDRAELALRGELEHEEEIKASETADDMEPGSQEDMESNLPFEASTEEAVPFHKVVDDSAFASRLQKAKESVNTEPTEGQKDAGNYRKGHLEFGGYHFTVENPKGSIRRGKDATGREWEQKMNNTYGYILGKYGKDGDHLDMFINDAQDLDNWNGTVYVVDQVDPRTGKLDEHKILYGFDSLEEAKQAYLSNYEEGWKGLGRITGVTKEGFDKWIDSSKQKIKEFADHSIAKEHMVESEDGAKAPQSQDQVLRDAVVEHLRQAGIEVSTDWQLGQKILDEYNGSGLVKKMGTTTNNRMSEVASLFTDRQLSDQQSVIASVYTGEKDNQTATFQREDGSTVRMKFKQGEDTKAGTKHSLYAHYGTTKGVINADDILRIPDIIEKGNKKQKGKNVEYTLKDGKTTYTVYAKTKGGVEVFQDFYSSWKIKNKEASASKPSITQDENTQSAQSNDANASSGAKVQQKTETAKESDENQPKFFKTPDGHAYGYTYQGRIYLDPRIATSETPIHEYGHLYCSMKRQTDPDGWKEWKQVMLNDKQAQPIIEKVKKEYPELAKEGREDDFVEEIVTQFSGKRGSERLKEIADEIAQEKGGIFGKAEAVTAMQRLKSILNRFWEGVAKMMGWKYTNASQIADRIMADMLNGVNPREQMNQAGEVEARNVTQRMGMGEQERRKTPAEETEDVDRNDQVVIMGDGTAMNINDIKPVGTGDFGDIYDQFKGKPKEAADFLIKKRKGDVEGVFHRDELGDVDLVWGKHEDHQGLEHMIIDHVIEANDFESVEQMMEVIDDVIKNGQKEKRNSEDKARFEKDGYLVSVRKQYRDNTGQVKYKKNWVVTAFDTSRKEHEKKRSQEEADAKRKEIFGKKGTSPKGTLTTPPLNPEADGVTLPSSDVLSEGKDTKNINTLQENRQKNSSEAPKFQRADSPEPEMTPEERQYWNKWDAAMKKWKERNAIPEDQTAPPEKPRYQQGEDALGYAQKLVQWNRQKSVWQTAPKLEDYRKVREDKDNLEEARENERRYPDSPGARMRRVAAEFQQIRSAMSRQKAYDKATVKAVTDFAQEFMKMGFGDELGRNDVNRILSSVKNATGATDIKKHVDNIMRVLTDNYLKNLKAEVNKLASVKELRQTAKGVDRQGKLDIKGQKMIQEFRKHTGAEFATGVDDLTRSTEEVDAKVSSLRERLAQISEEMEKGDPAMWEEEYEGTSLALQYFDNIARSQALVTDYKSLREDAVKNYKTSGRDYKAQTELLDSYDKAIEEEKIKRIGMYGDMIGRLQGNITESMKGAHEFTERKRERVKRIHTLAARDMDGIDADTTHPETWKSKLNNAAIPRLLLGPMGTFEQMLKLVGRNSLNGDGWLYNEMMRNYIDSVDREQVGREEAFKALDDKVTEIFGKKMRLSDLYGTFRDTKKFPEATLEWLTADGEMRKHTVSQLQLLDIYMWNKQPDGAIKLREQGITDEKVEEIKDAIDPRLIQFADWFQGEFSSKLREKYSKVYERVFGAAMPAVENYFPLRIIGDAITRDVDVTADPNSDNVLPSNTTGSIIRRKVNTNPLDILGTDAVSLMIEHVDKMEKWAAFVEWYEDINALLSYNRFKNQVKNMGNTIYGSGDELWGNFRKTAQMAAGTYRPSRSEADKAITTIASGVTGAKIAFRPYTALKQLLSAPAFMSDASAKYFSMSFMNPKNFWHDNIKWAMENMPVLRKRWHSRDLGDTRLMDKTGWGYWDTNVRGFMAQYGMWMNGAIDVATCAAGARAIYRTRYDKYIKEGYDKDVAHKRAIQDAEIGYNLTQQSSEGAFVSSIQKDRTLFANMWTVFRNSSMAYTRQSVVATRNLKHLMADKDRLIDTSTRQMVEKGIDKDQARKNAEAEYNHSIWRNGVRLAVSAWILPLFWELGAKVPYLVFGDDDEEKKKMMNDVLAKELVIGPTEGFFGGQTYNALWGAASSRDVRDVYNQQGFKEATKAGLKAMDQQDTNPLPLFADMGRLMNKFSKDEAAGFQDMVNIAVQMGTGLNPQTITDPIVAAIDWSRGDMDSAKEIELFLLRLLMVPQESAKNIYIDELGMNAEEAKKLSFDEAAERYSKYMKQKSAPMFGWVYSDEAEKKRMDSYRKRFFDDVTERIGNLTDEEVERNRSRAGNASEEELYAKEQASRKDYKGMGDRFSQMKKDALAGDFETLKQLEEFWRSEDYQQYKAMQGDLSDVGDRKKQEAGGESSKDFKYTDEHEANTPAGRYNKLADGRDEFEDWCVEQISKKTAKYDKEYKFMQEAGVGQHDLDNYRRRFGLYIDAHQALERMRKNFNELRKGLGNADDQTIMRGLRRRRDEFLRVYRFDDIFRKEEKKQ